MSARQQLSLAAAGVLIAVAPLGAQTASSPEPRHSIWLVYGGDHPVSRRVGLVFDAQLRMTQDADHQRQVLLRPGVSFAVTPRVKLSGGYTATASRDDGADPFSTRRPEHRAWLSAQLAHGLGPLSLGHRVRAEHRWLPGISVDDAGVPMGETRVTAERMRYSLRATIPLTARAADRGLYLAASDEVFASFGGYAGDMALDQNRATVVVGMRASRSLRVEMGYMLQSSGEDGRLDERNHTLQITAVSSAPLRRR
jgi:hypothetical protein